MARSFNGSSQYLHNSSATAGINFPIGMSAWIYPTDVTVAADIMSLSTTTDGTGDSILQIRLRGDVAGDPVSVQQAGDGIAYSTTGVTVNTWHHVYGIFTSNAEREIWLDGGSYAINTTSRTWSGYDTISIGATKAFSTTIGYFPGYIAEAGLWYGNPWPSGVSIEALSSGYSPRFYRGGLQYYYPLFGNASPEPSWGTAKDSLTVNAAPPAVAHPRVIYPTAPHFARKATPPAAVGRSFSVIVG